MTLARSTDFLDRLLSVELKLVALGWIEIQRQGNRRLVSVKETRLIDWAVACCSKTMPSEMVSRLAESRTPDQRWWVLRQLLPDAAILALDMKLDLLT